MVENKDILITKEMLFDFPSYLLTGCICPQFKQNNVTLSYYGGKLCSVKIDDKEIEELFEIPQASTIDDELHYRITEDAVEFILNKINKN